MGVPVHQAQRRMRLIAAAAGINDAIGPTQSGLNWLHRDETDTDFRLELAPLSACAVPSFLGPAVAGIERLSGAKFE
jgi:hypothetical protein